MQNAIRLNRIGHGYIFSGQRGVGKTTVARLLAKALNCQRGPSPEPCGECDSCREIAAGRAVDVIEIDAASNRGIDAIRELRENARYAPARDRYKVFIIDEAHQITPEGFNALLKTLEEPPAHVIFLLATTEVHQFPETILSRCQHFSLHALTFAEILGHLEKICADEKVEADPEALAVLAKSGQGSIRDSLSRLEQALAAFGSRLEGAAVRRFLGEPPSSLMEEVFHAIQERKREPILQVVEKLVEEGYQLTHFCTQLIGAVRNLLVIRVAGPDQRLLESSAEEIQRLTALAEGFTEESLMRCLEILLQLHQELRYSMEPRFQMELGLLKLVDAERLVSIEDLLAQMESKPESRMETSPRPAIPSGPPEPERPQRKIRLDEPSTQPDIPSHGPEQSARPGKLTPWEQDSLRKKQSHDPSALATVSPEEAPGGVVSAVATAEVPLPSMETKLSSQEEGWAQEILRQLEEKGKHLLASFLSNAKSWEFGETEVEIRLAHEGSRSLITDLDRQRLEDLCAGVMGRRVKVNFGDNSGNRTREARGKDAEISREAAGAEAARSAESRARQDPEILEFEKLFGKPVTGIRNWRK